MAYKYFLYSSRQLEFRSNVERSMGRTFRVGTVFTKGTRKSFTELSDTPNSIYPDAKIVAEGEETSFRFTLPQGVQGT